MICCANLRCSRTFLAMALYLLKVERCRIHAIHSPNNIYISLLLFWNLYFHLVFSICKQTKICLKYMRHIKVVQLINYSVFKTVLISLSFSLWLLKVFFLWNCNKDEVDSCFIFANFNFSILLVTFPKWYV